MHMRRFQIRPSSTTTMTGHLLAAILVTFISFAITGIEAQDECQALAYCGRFCCPDSAQDLIMGRMNCCENSESCCSDPIDTPTCGDTVCVTRAPRDEVYDGDGNLRNQCCRYFRSGCCSQEENETLNTLYILAIALGCGVFALAIIIALLCVCCCCCFCCN